MSKLNPKQQAFADEYIITGNAYRSALKAGYKENYAKNAQEKLVEKRWKSIRLHSREAKRSSN